METKNHYDGVDPHAVSTIRFHARQLARGNAVPGMDVEDFEQDLILDLLRRQQHFDPDLASFPTFAERIITNRVATLTAPTARLRAERAMVSLDEPVAGTDGDEDACLGDLLPEEAGIHADHRGDPEEAVGLRRDVEGFVGTLSPALQRCAAILIADNVAGAAKAAGLHRGTVYEAARRIARQAARIGLDIYIHPTPTLLMAAR